MTDIERYNKQLKGTKFKVSDKEKDHNSLIEWFTIGKIINKLVDYNDYTIDIFWLTDNGKESHNTYMLSNIIKFIDNGTWVLSITYLRKEKLKQLRNDQY
jgi:hypothetical protein